MERRETIAALLGMLCLLTCMQVNMTNMFNLFCIHRLHSLNMQLILLEFGRQTMERKRQQRRRSRRHNQYRRCRLSRPSAKLWFETYLTNQEIPDKFFKGQLRMKRCTFDALLNLLRTQLSRQDTALRDRIPPEKVLAIGIYRLAHGFPYTNIGASFGVGKSTAVEAVQDVTEALFELRNELIKFPASTEETRSCTETFSALSNLPNVVGAIGCSHIQIKAPAESAIDYFSRYQQFDFIVQGVVDGRKMFLDFAAGFPGSLHDSRVLRNSTLYKRAEEGEILANPTAQLGSQNIRPYLVGANTHPLRSWLLKPFPVSTEDQEEIAFNKELSAARLPVECALGVLTSRWGILAKRLDTNSMSFSVKTTTVCAVLHNFCIMNGDKWDARDGYTAVLQSEDNDENDDDDDVKDDDDDDDDDDDHGSIGRGNDDDDDEGDVVTDNKITVVQDGDTVREVLKCYVCSM